MTLAQRFDSLRHEYLHFDRIPPLERWHASHTLCGLLMVRKLLKPWIGLDLRGGNEIVFLNTLDAYRDMSDVEITYLLRCGIHVDEDKGCLAAF